VTAIEQPFDTDWYAMNFLDADNGWGGGQDQTIDDVLGSIWKRTGSTSSANAISERKPIFQPSFIGRSIRPAQSNSWFDPKTCTRHNRKERCQSPGIDSATPCCHGSTMNEAQREVLKNVERAAHSAGNLAEKAYHLTQDEAAHKIAEAVLALSQTVGVLARALAEEAK